MKRCPLNVCFQLLFFRKRRLLKRLDSNCVREERHLNALMRLSRNNIIDLAFAFCELHIVIVPSWSCFFLFVENDSVLPLIEDILCTEGLHMRKVSENQELND